MFVYSWIFVGLVVLVWFNYGPIDKIAPVDRVAFSLIIIGIGIMPLSMWLFFVPSFILTVIGAALLVLFPTDDYYKRRNERWASEAYLERKQQERDDASFLND